MKIHEERERERWRVRQGYFDKNNIILNLANKLSISYANFFAIYKLFIEILISINLQTIESASIVLSLIFDANTSDIFLFQVRGPNTNFFDRLEGNFA